MQPWGSKGSAIDNLIVSFSVAYCCSIMLLCGFESGLGLESLGLSMSHFLKLVAKRFLRFPLLLHWFNDSANKIKLK